ncbi:hypothetical protein Droror1_Dr00019874 [Drosera rotundifolia]
MKEEVERAGGLEVIVKESRTFSVGQRQLLCLALAFLKSSKVLCLDECTANIDAPTASVLHNIIATECKGMTMITVIAISDLLQLRGDSNTWLRYRMYVWLLGAEERQQAPVFSSKKPLSTPLVVSVSDYHGRISHSEVVVFGSPKLSCCFSHSWLPKAPYNSTTPIHSGRNRAYATYVAPFLQSEEFVEDVDFLIRRAERFLKAGKDTIIIEAELLVHVLDYSALDKK